MSIEKFPQTVTAKVHSLFFGKKKIFKKFIYTFEMYDVVSFFLKEFLFSILYNILCNFVLT